jgi:hypothetical protein
MSALAFIKDLLAATFGQMASLFAGVFIFGLLIHFVSQLTFRSLEKAFGRNGVYLVAWLGTPVHELGHVIFCVIFFHRIVAVAFFQPDPVTGTLGYVSHKWSRTNPWQVLGNLFIGIGPVIIGCMVLFGLFYLLIPESSRVWEAVSAGMSGINGSPGIGDYLDIFGSSSLAVARLIFTAENLAGWRFWVFCYLSICVASNMRLSMADIKGSLSGIGCVVVIFLLTNLLGLLTGLGGENFLPLTASSLGVVYSLLLLALIMALLGFAAVYIISAIVFRLKYRRILTPF